MDAGREFVFLGTGTSVGVPVIGCECPVCTSSNPRNNRTRSSVLLRLPGGTLLVDTSPELRIQLLREKVSLVHAVLYTHYHADHLYGLDDVRVFPKKLGGPLPLYCDDDVERVIRRAFAYAFEPKNADKPAGYLPKLTFCNITAEPFHVLGQRVVPVPLVHSKFHVFGFRFDRVAYCTDVSSIPHDSWNLLKDLDVLILDALNLGPANPAHFNLDMALEAIARLKPKQTYLTHMGHEMEYDLLVKRLPANVSPAYDGLRFRF